jgi:hypothetical protein
MAIKQWEKLTCECGSIEFVCTNELMWKENQGTTIKPHGYMCAKCSKVTNTANLINKARTRVKQKEIEELQGELLNG